ncbi:GLPGLI family protein [Chryseobacterium sp. EO14]|uniref:GLPGLI family protein n=1 Tax=Chryseobacterium sp. EO14 TaxID=2950551 RepID=UPI00210EB376|nr:GLPGLI family protein [Chryseobacterium sp. EO14]MCQ4141380.1 GLPGLI family protein [Chryseobacterium sp. EO14]
MKKIIIAFALLLGMFFNAQNKRFVYEYRFVSDSTKKDVSITESIYLDVSKKGSKFYSRDKYISDSLIEAQSKHQNGDFSKIKFGMVPYVVQKSYPDYKILFFNRLDMDGYKVSDERKMDWNILPEKQKVGEFNAQKATTDFAGRKWTAWFVTEIPIQDGPYKFHGLPGLIVKLEDKTNSHSYVLKEIKDLKDQEWKSQEENHRIGALISLNQEKYKKQFLEYRINPTKGIRQMLASGTKIMMTDEKGNKLDVEDMIRERERKVKEDNAKDNNLLELDLLK